MPVAVLVKTRDRAKAAEEAGTPAAAEAADEEAAEADEAVADADEGEDVFVAGDEDDFDAFEDEGK
jgi:hypothetical protein